MRGKSTAAHMVDIMNEQQRNIVWYGDLDILHECAKRSGMYDRPGNHHPIAINNRVLSGLERSDFFVKGYIKHVGRPSRAFTLKDEYCNFDS